MALTNLKPSLKALSRVAGVPIGTCVDLTALAEDPEYGPAVAREFTVVVAENIFKPAYVWTAEYQYDFSQTDRLAQFAADNALALRGHTLLWHQSVPNWLSGGSYKAGQVKDLLRGYIHAVVGRYKGVIVAWDVVNEAVGDLDDGEMRDAPEGDALLARDDQGWRTNSFWYQTLGREYLPLAFQWAHEADPDVALYYNDYEAEGLNLKSDKIYEIVRGLVADGSPIHGVGLQGHLVNGWRATDGNRANIRRIVELGLDWQFTEVDIRMKLDGQPASERQLQDQADGYRDLMELCLTEPRCQGLLVWGFTDKYSWIPAFRPGQGAALLLDEHYQPKPAYFAVADALRAALSD